MAEDQTYMPKIRSVQPGSIADQLGVEAGDYLLTVNVHAVTALHREECAFIFLLYGIFYAVMV